MRRLLVVLLAGVMSLVSGCAVSQQRAATLAGLVTAAVAHLDHEAFAGAFAEAAGPPEWLWTNLVSLDQVSFEVGDDGRWRVRWRYPGEELFAYHVLGVQTSCGPRRCLITSIGQEADQPTPLWLTGRLTLSQQGTIILAGTDDAQLGWTEAAVATEQTLTGFSTLAPLIHPPARLVVEVPADGTGFEQVMAATSFDFRASPAATWRADFAAQPGTAAAGRVVINPTNSPVLTPAQRHVLLAHELTHLATDHLGATATGWAWVSEGLAHHIGLSGDQEEYHRVMAGVSLYCAQSTAAPKDQDFAAPQGVEPAYAWSAAVIARVLDLPDGPDRLMVAWQGQAGAIPEEMIRAVCAPG